MLREFSRQFPQLQNTSPCNTFFSDKYASTAYSTAITRSDANPRHIEGIGLTFRFATPSSITTWKKAMEDVNAAQGKYITRIVLGTFVAYRRVDSCGYRCLACQSMASWDPVTREIFCDASCEPGAITDVSIEISATAEMFFSGVGNYQLHLLFYQLFIQHLLQQRPEAPYDSITRQNEPHPTNDSY